MFRGFFPCVCYDLEYRSAYINTVCLLFDLSSPLDCPVTTLLEIKHF